MIVKESILAENYELTKENARLKSEVEGLKKYKDTCLIKMVINQNERLKSERKAFRDWVVRETWSCRRYRKMGNKFIQKELVLSEYLTLRDVLKQLREK